MIIGFSPSAAVKKPSHIQVFLNKIFTESDHIGISPSFDVFLVCKAVKVDKKINVKIYENFFISMEKFTLMCYNIKRCLYLQSKCTELINLRS